VKPKTKRITPQKVDKQRHFIKRHLPVLVSAAALAVVTLLAFSNSFSAGFILDNKGLLLEDPRIRQLTYENIGLILHHSYWWPRGEAGLYRPFTTLSYLFNYAILGSAGQPAGYHWINVLLHICNVLLVYALARTLIREFWPSFFMAGLWAVHPLLTESVTNMIGRSDLLAGLAILSGLLIYLKSTESSGWRRISWLVGLMAVTAAGIFSKESAIAIMGVIALYEFTWWKERKQGWALLMGCLAMLPPIAVMLYQRFMVLSASPPAEFPFTDNPIASAGFWMGRFTAIKLIGRYLVLTAWPAKLSTDYSYAQIPLAGGSLEDWAAVAAVLALIALAVSLYWWNRTAFFLVWFAAITFVPASNLLFPIGTIMAERFLYLSTIGLLGCAVILIYSVAERRKVKRVAPVVLSLIAIAFAIRTWIRNQDWQDQHAIVEANLRASPNSFKAHMMASSLYFDGADNNLDRAIDESEKSLAILDSLPDSLNTPGVYRDAGRHYLAKGDSLQQGNPSESIPAYERASKLLLRSIAIDKSTRAEYDRNGGADWARRHSAAAATTKSDPEAHWMLAVAYGRLGKVEQALAEAGEALAVHPVDPVAYRQIAYAFAAAHRMDDAAVALFEGLLMTSDLSLRSDLLKLYRASADSNSCAIIAGPAGPALNPACDLVRKSLCPASVEVVKAAMETSRLDAAKKLKQTSLQDYGCPAGPFEQVLPD
jgi:tetratricopeptide (TPR) repeat protein